MVSLTRSTAVLDLGSRLVDQLACGNDLLASWMAHYIAELIQAAETASDDQKTIAEEACFTAILKLWEHRATFPEPARVAPGLEAVLSTLASLDIGQTDHRYYPMVLREVKSALSEDAREWLQTAVDIDRAARLLIGASLRSAAEQVAADAEPWVELAAQAGAAAGPERAVVDLVRRDDIVSEAVRSAYIVELRTLAEFANALATDLETGTDEPAGD